MDAKKSGIETPLMTDYESEMLSQVGTSTLGGALNQRRSRNR
jgi:hypothetical protein